MPVIDLVATASVAARVRPSAALPPLVAPDETGDPFGAVVAVDQPMAFTAAAFALAGGAASVVLDGSAAEAALACRAPRLWCASLVVASATARAVSASGLGPPTYVLDDGTFEQCLAAEAVECARVGGSPDPAWAPEMDAFDFAMEATWQSGQLRLRAVGLR
ncbi:MAG: hypothetical protein ACYDEN_03445 [Acidimicrobiales bacterium]